ncbi:MAG: YggS family pyridoxal phosphate-dependent enzyme [Chlorobi bacterium]|nr:YggS family pyridoxal phosphate-dependent enzyme [Chlorobiota bacterium]
MNIVENITKIKSELPERVKLVAVSKTKPNEDIMQAYNGGHKIFGENKVQDLVNKYETLPKDIEWHFIGHLQSNKVKYIVPFVSLIHAVDSLKLLKIINKEGGKINRKINCLLQMHIAEEETKFGLSFDEINKILDSEEYSQTEFVKITGLMGMATNTNDTAQIHKEFAYLKSCFEKTKVGYFKNDENFTNLSMGMSGDYKIAAEEGSTMIRVGSLIFGARG